MPTFKTETQNDVYSFVVWGIKLSIISENLSICHSANNADSAIVCVIGIRARL